MTSGERPGLGALARWAVLATTLAMIAALLASSWANLRAVDEAAETLHRGQGEPLLMAVRQVVRRFSGLPPTEALAALVETQASAGLRYVGLMDGDGEVLLEAGQRTAALDRNRGPRRESVVVVDLGPRVLMRASARRGRPDPRPPKDGRPRVRPPKRERFGGDRPPRRRPPGGRPDRRPQDGRPDRRPPDPGIVIEFEPLVVSQLAQRATRSLTFSALAGVFLLSTAGVFWRLLKKKEEAERRQEHGRRLQALGEMSAVMAHEIRNPLASLKGNAQILAERLPEAGRERQKAERIVGEAKRLESLCQALLDFCRTRPLDRREVDPSALVREIAGSLENANVEIDARDAPGRFSLDPLRMRQVLLNLMGNAREASPEGVPVEVCVAGDGGRLAISVRDRGEGIAAGDEERLFEPFFTKRTRGTGLGLAVARRVVELHGGTLVAANAEGGGAIFRISIPEGA